MKRKSLYTESEGYSLEAQALDIATENAIKAIFAEYVEKGYSCRDISHIIQQCVSGIESETVLNLRRIQTRLTHPKYKAANPRTTEISSVQQKKSKAVSAAWVLNQLSGMKFPAQGQAYDYMKKCIEADPDLNSEG